MTHPTRASASVSVLPFVLGSALSAVLAAWLAAGGGEDPYTAAAAAMALELPVAVLAKAQE